MRVLIIKTSSMGDLVHTLPALTDAMRAVPGIKFDWLVEENFAYLPGLHPAVDRIIPVALRRWRKHIFAKTTRQEMLNLRKKLREQKYDLIIDAQGLVKSAWLGLLGIGPRAGLDWESARESLASLFYQRKYKVNFYQHAIVRMRSLFAKALNYEVVGEPDFHLAPVQTQNNSTAPYLVFLHGTTWTSKQWPEQYWIELAKLAEAAGYRVKVSGASDEEVARSHRIAAACKAVDAMPRLKISEMAVLLAGAKGAVAVDTGFAHLAAGMNLPIVSIYGSTNPEYTGAVGKHSIVLNTEFSCSPCLKRECTYTQLSAVKPACYTTLPPQKVWQTLTSLV